MITSSPSIESQHRTMLAIECLHAGLVLSVVIAATVVYLTHVMGLPSDLLGFVYGGAITYAGGRAGAARGALTRQGDGNGNGTSS